jgi:hypothetical protein
MTTFVSIFGIVGRFAGDLVTSALGWASSLLFGRVPRSHEIFLVWMMAGSFLWIVAILGLLIPGIASVALTTTPHPPFMNSAWLAVALVAVAVVLPLGVGLAGYLVPAAGDRPGGLVVVRETLRGYLLTPMIGALLIFLAGVGLTRKVRSIRHGWSDMHIPIVVEPGGYDEMTGDLRDALSAAGMSVKVVDAPRILTLPAFLLTRVAGSNVRKLRADQLVELKGRGLRIGLYPYDIAISCAAPRKTRVRAVVLSALAATAAHLTTSAEAQAVEDRLQHLAARNHQPDEGSRSALRATFEAVDKTLLDLVIPADEWDVLYRLRLQVELDRLMGSGVR